jgi:hypothetical protein
MTQQQKLQQLFAHARMVAELRANSVIIINPRELPAAQMSAREALDNLHSAVAAFEHGGGDVEGVKV